VRLSLSLYIYIYIYVCVCVCVHVCVYIYEYIYIYIYALSAVLASAVGQASLVWTRRLNISIGPEPMLDYIFTILVPNYNADNFRNPCFFVAQCCRSPGLPSSDATDESLCGTRTDAGLPYSPS